MPVTITNAGIGLNARSWLANVVTFCGDLLSDAFAGEPGATIGASLVRDGDASAGVSAAALAVLDEVSLAQEQTFGGQDWLWFPFESSYAVPWASTTHQCLDWFPEASASIHEATMYNSLCPPWQARVTGRLTRLRDALNAAGLTGEAAIALSLSNALSAAGDQSSLLSPQAGAQTLVDLAKLGLGIFVVLKIVEIWSAKA